MMPQQAITLREYAQRISLAVNSAPGLSGVWVVAETSDLRMSGGHCYLELLEKDDGGRSLARLRANIWASAWTGIARNFQAATGTPLGSGMKIMACLSASYHPAYGMSVTISAIDPSYTLGEAVRRRNEIIARLQAEGLLELNRHKRWAIPALRVAIISAPGAAGYGDFINQLYNNPHRLNFVTELFTATMQGDRTVPTVTDALQRIAARAADFDCVVIIRGGGSTSDLAAFDDYGLASMVARFELPVVVGIGHERDITVLDYVANMRVKTPTAAAEWLIARGKGVLDALDNANTLIANAVNARIAGDREQLARLTATIPGAVQAQLTRTRATLDNAAVVLASLSAKVIGPARVQLQAMAAAITTAAKNRLTTARGNLNAYQALIDVLSPQATLRRGFSLTVGPDGHAITDAATIPAGTKITTHLAKGTITSITTTDK